MFAGVECGLDQVRIEIGSAMENDRVERAGVGLQEIRERRGGDGGIESGGSSGSSVGF